MTTDVMIQEKLDIGRVIQTTFSIVGRNFRLLAGLSGLMIVAPYAVILAVTIPFTATFMTAGPIPALASLVPLIGGLVLAFALIWAAFQAAAIHVAISDLNGTRPSFGASLGVGVRSALPVIGVVILALLACWAGLILFIVPGVMIAVAFILAVPARVIERVGVFESFSRSRALTRNNRWRIFVLLLVYMITIWVLEGVITSLTGGLAATNFGQVALRGLLGLAVSFVAGMVTTTGVAALYFELRRIKDGVGASELAAVFD
ncbi:MAG TPA: hypothetical protein VFW47_15430 [Phenylobacterium sp.]|nr:hypothetical protein [Phenylobacterium sp.]